MRIRINKSLDKRNTLILGMWEEEKHNYKSLSKNLAKELSEAIKRKSFSKKFGESYSTKVGQQRVYVYGLGKKKEFTLEHLRRILGRTIKCVKAKKFVSYCTNIVQVVKSGKNFDDLSLGRASAEALILANYGFDKYLSKDRKEKQTPVTEVILQSSSSTTFSKGLKEGSIIAESTNFTRDLVNEPASICNSIYLEKVARLVAKHRKIRMRVLNHKDLKKLGMGALLGVNAGSEYPPKLVFLEYRGGKGKYTALVGKGITFDSGGYNLKPTKYIEDMKTDMGGAAAVLGTIKAAAALGIRSNILGVMPLCENMVSHTAQRPGDIVKAYNGMTIEIGNTDAEGRLILADSLAYTDDKYKPDVIIDLATLTGSCVVAFGYYVAGLMGKDEALLEELKKAGLNSGDRVWPMPFFEEYHNWMDGSISDLNNIAMKGKGYEAGTITAGVFLSKFVEKAKWAHIDIAGSAYWGVDGDYLQKGSTGSGVRVLSYWLMGC